MSPALPPNQTRMRSLLSIQVNCFPSLVLSWRRNLRQESLRTRTKDDKFAVDASLHPNGEKQEPIKFDRLLREAILLCPQARGEKKGHRNLAFSSSLAFISFKENR